jgi:hypothetical protein
MTRLQSKLLSVISINLGKKFQTLMASDQFVFLMEDSNSPDMLTSNFFLEAYWPQKSPFDLWTHCSWWNSDEKQPLVMPDYSSYYLVSIKIKSGHTKVDCYGKRLMVCWKIWGFWNWYLCTIVLKTCKIPWDNPYSWVSKSSNFPTDHQTFSRAFYFKTGCTGLHPVPTKTGCSASSIY